MLKPENGRLETADALKLAGLDREDWNNALKRKLFSDPPKTIPGQSRRFTVNDIIAAFVMGELFERRVAPQFACQIASDVLREVTKAPNVQTLSAWKCTKHDGSNYVVVKPTTPQKSATELFRFNVGEMRQRTIASIEQRMLDGTY